MDSLTGQLAPALRVGIASAIAFVALATAVPAAAVARVECGQTVTRDLRLDRDLVNCSGNGLVVGADGITIDLGGHVVDGRGRGTGILNGHWGDGHRDVVIRNGTVRNFKLGVRSGARGTRITGLRVTGNAAGGVALRSRECQVERNVITGNAYGHGVFVGGAGGCRVTGNRVAGHLGAGIVASRSRAHVVERNVVSANRQAGILLAGTASAAVARNTVRANAGPGVWIFDGASASLLAGNVLSRNDRGVLVTFGATGSRIEGNSVSGSRRAGIRLSGTGPGNQLLGNLVVLSGEHGISLEESPGAELRRNAVHDSLVDGIFLATGGVAVIGNSSTRNGDDGIDLEDANVTLAGNFTAGNGDLGIEAPPGFVP